MADHFAPDAIVRRVNIEPALLLGAGRALALQLAHPAVAHGVRDHSDFQHNPFKRLQGTLEATVAVVFGSEELATGVGRRIQWIHEFVVGPDYRANDPDNLLWVHATLVDTALRCYTYFVGPLTHRDREAYYQEMKRVAAAFGVPHGTHPDTLVDFEQYVADTVATLEVTDTARELMAFVLEPTLPARLDVPLTPLLGNQRLNTVAMLPDRLRDEFHLPFSPRTRAKWERRAGRIRAVNRRLPRPVRIAPTVLLNQMLLLQAANHVRKFEQRTGQRTAA